LITLSVDDPIYAALRASEERLRFAQQSGRIGLWEWDVVTNTTWWSSTLYDLLGHEVGDGQTSFDQFMEHVHPKDVDWIVAELQDAIAQARGIDIEFRVIRPDGAIRWLSGVGAVDVDDHGKVRIMRGSNLDITDRKTLEAKLLELNFKLTEQVAIKSAEQERFWNLSEELIAKVSSDGAVLTANPAASKMLGQRSLIEALVAADKPVFIDAIDRACKSGATVRFATGLHATDGALSHIMWSAACDTLSDDLFIIGHDVTDAVEHQTRLRETETRLAQVQKMETLGELASGIAHDFNNLLVPILGVLDMLKRRPSGDEDFDTLTMGAAQAAESARAMVRRILNFSKSQHLPARDFQPADMLNNLSFLLKRILPDTITLRLDYAPDLPVMRLPPQQLEVTLMNLVVNARDAMPNGGEITIRVLPDGKRMLFYVIDEGIGMDSDTLEKARQRFFTTKAPESGTGLGLYMATRFVEQCGGEMVIESAAGKGTSIILDLPCDGKGKRRTNSRGGETV
jgi:PAS domain S-box-containing protein